MSMVCGLQSFDKTNLERVRSGEKIEEYSDQSVSSFPLELFIVEIIVVVCLFGPICNMFPKFWYLWLLLALSLLGCFYVENIRIGRKLNETAGIPAEGEICLDKAWHGVHFLLTGSAWEGDEPLNFLVAAGEPIEGTDSGYGEDRMFTSAEVKQIDKALQGISKEEFESRFDPDKMMTEDIYPMIWNRPKEEDDTLGYISGHFSGLKQYIHRTAEQNMGMIAGLS